jgi:hypothetical protein
VQICIFYQFNITWQFYILILIIDWEKYTHCLNFVHDSSFQFVPFCVCLCSEGFFGAIYNEATFSISFISISFIIIFSFSQNCCPMLDFTIFKFQGGQSTLENCQVLQVRGLSPFSIYDYQIYMESFFSVLQYCVLFLTFCKFGHFIFACLCCRNVALEYCSVTLMEHAS